MIGKIEELKKRGEISFEDATIGDLYMLKEFFDLKIDGDKKKVILKKL